MTPRQLRRTARCTGLVKLQVCPDSVRNRRHSLFLQPLLQHTASPARLLAGAAQYRTVCACASGRTSCALSALRAGLVASGVLWDALRSQGQRRRYASCGKKDRWTRCGGAGRGYAAPLLAAPSAGECGGPHGGSWLRCRCCCWWQHWRGHAAPRTRTRTGWRGSGRRWTTLSTTPSAP